MKIEIYQKNQSLKMGEFLAPGNAHIVWLAPLAYEDKVLEQNNASENEFMHEQDRGSAMISENEEITEEEEHDLLAEKDFAMKIPEKEVVTYLVCDVDQQLPDLPQDFSLILSDGSQLKKASTISNTIQASPIMSKIVQIESNVEKNEFETDMQHKIYMLESKIQKYRKQHEKNKRKIKSLMQSQNHNLKKIASLKESVNILKHQKYIAHAKSEILKRATPSLLEILSEKRCQNKDITDSRRHSFAVYDFVKKLYSISPDAYKYVHSYFGTSLPSEKAVSKWILKKNDELNFNSEENSNEHSSFDDCLDVQDFIDVKKMK